MTSMQLRLALSARAYHSGTIRLVEPDLSGCSHFIATRGGLFASDRAMLRLIAHGLFYGVTILGDVVFAFEACDRPREPSAMGRIVRLRLAGGRVAGADVFAAGLDNGCHQIDMIGDRLCVADTYNQRVLRYPLGGGAPDVLHPIPPAAANDWAGGYAHVNSLVAQGDNLLLMLHNGADKTGRPSEIARLDRDWRLIERMPLAGTGCHNIAVLEDGTLLACGSSAGELVGPGGLKAPVCDLMTRGLSVGEDVIAVGGSPFAERSARDGIGGAVFFLDRAYRQVGRVEVPAPVMEVRRIDGRDRSLSQHLARFPAAPA